MSVALCINCGNQKAFSVEVCLACNFAPDSPEDRVKSIILSTEDIGDLYEGKSLAELQAIAPLVAAHTYSFDEAQVRALATAMEESLATPFSSLVFEMVRFFWPAWLAIGIAILLWLTR